MRPRTLTALLLCATIIVVGAVSYRYGRDRAANGPRIAADTVASAATDVQGRLPYAAPGAPPAATGDVSSTSAGKATDTSPVPKPVVVKRPHLERAIPSSADLSTGDVVEVELRGTGFTATGNAVWFGSLSVGSVASANGTSLRFIVPSQHPARGEVPPMMIQAGDYAVSIRNRNGVSDTISFTLRSGPP
jgi:hypothetical protein